MAKYVRWIMDAAVLLAVAGILAAYAGLRLHWGQRKHEEYVQDKLQAAIGKLEQAEKIQGENVGRLEQAATMQQKANENMTNANKKLDDAGAKLEQSLKLQREADAQLRQANTVLGRALQEQQKANELLNQTIEANKELIAQQQETIKFVTGGDSYPYLHFAPVRGSTESDVIYKVRGEYPVRDVLVAITNITKLQSSDAIDFAGRIRDAKDYFQPGTVWEGTELAVPFPFPDGEYGNYEIVIHYANKRIVQLVSIKRVQPKGSCFFAYRVFHDVGRANDGKRMIEEIPALRYVDQYFPCDNKDKVEWLDFPDQWANLEAVSGHVQTANEVSSP